MGLLALHNLSGFVFAQNLNFLGHPHVILFGVSLSNDKKVS